MFADGFASLNVRANVQGSFRRSFHARMCRDHEPRIKKEEQIQEALDTY